MLSLSSCFNVQEYSASPDDYECRLDLFLAQKIQDLSRTRLQHLIREGHVFAVDQRGLSIPVSDPNFRIQQGQTYQVHLPLALEDSPLVPHSMPLTILYEDENLLVLDKPAGLSVHPGAGEAKITLVHGLLAHCGESLSGISGVKKPGIVHRLDKDTSGLLVVAKNDRAHHHLSQQFASRSLTKIYWAFVRGRPSPAAGRLETFMGRHPRHRLKMAVLPQGRLALTTYRVLKESGSVSLLECQIHTGRTHQIRVHCAHIGSPLIGDTLYGGPQSHPRQALHAKRLTFIHPKTLQEMTFECPLPEDLASLYQAVFP